MTQGVLFPLGVQKEEPPGRGQRIAWRHKQLGLCVGRVAGVYETGITARRDGVGDNTKPHTLPWGSFWKVNA